MTGIALYADISAWQPATINWAAYKAWSEAGDGISRVCFRSSYGTGYTDEHFADYRQGALAAGIQQIGYYHYCYPQYNSAQAEADWQQHVVGAIRESDWLMLDFEESAPQATGAWADAWLSQQSANYGGRLPTLYASLSVIEARLSETPDLSRFPLTLADWTFNPNVQPPAPAPWKELSFWQWTDALTVPGMGSGIDVDLFLNGDAPPIDWLLQSAKDTWQAATGWNGSYPGEQNNIFSSYIDEYRAGRNHGVPLCGWQSHDYHGTPIAVMECSNGRAEDQGGSVRWIY